MEYKIHVRQIENKVPLSICYLPSADFCYLAVSSRDSFGLLSTTTSRARYSGKAKVFAGAPMHLRG